MTHSITPSHPPGCPRQATLEQRLACLADAGPAALQDRLAVIDREWSAGRMTKATLGVTMLVGFALTALLSPYWLILPALGAVFLLQYLFDRTSWLGKLFQAIGYRSGAEIDQEKFALRTLRGDFRSLPTFHDIESADDISRLEGEGGIAIEVEAAKLDPKAAVREVLDAART